MKVGDRVFYRPEPGVRPFRGTVTEVNPAASNPRSFASGGSGRVVVKWDYEDDGEDDSIVSIMFVSQLSLLSVVDRLAELA